MTAEMAILNQSAVALAADSAVTIGRLERIFNTANKLFTLSKYAPVGVMLHNNMTLMSLPWETIIKEFRQSLGVQRHGTMQEYADHFLDYLKGHAATWFPPAHQERTVNAEAAFIHQVVVRAVGGDLADRLHAGGPFNTPDVAALTQEAQRIRGNLLANRRLACLSAGFEQQFRQAYGLTLHHARSTVFGAAQLGQPLEDLLDELVLLRFRQEFFTEAQSGIVIAGFGDDELFPALRAYTVEHVVAGELRQSSGASVNVDLEPANAAFILPFAQSDEVLSFVTGSHPQLESQLQSELRTRLTELVQDLLQLAPDLTPTQRQGLMAAAAPRVQHHLQQFEQTMGQHRYGHYLEPIYRTVRVLPKDDLAAMAEALVSLSSLRHQATIGPQTVGGPVDVAVISKGDGFIWIRRKHYFDATLNPQFLANYYR